MFFVFMLGIIVLAMIGLGSVLGSGAAGIGALFLLPFLFLKVMFVLMLFGFIGRRFAGGRPWTWDEPSRRGRSRRRRQQPSASSEDRFEEWHRMAHAREEVDSWAPNLDGTEPE